jgi:hypothetical protein
VVRLEDVADRDRRDADDVSDEVGERRLPHAPYTGFCQGTVWSARQVEDVGALGFIARAIAISSSSLRPPGAQSLDDRRTESGLSAGPGRAHRRDALRVESESLADVAAVGVRALVREAAR